MSEPTAQVATSIRATPAQVWQGLTDPDLIRRYFMGATVTTDWEVGSPITFTGEWNGQRFEDRGEILAVVEDEVLRYSHWSPMSGTPDVPDSYHVVDIELKSDGAHSTRVVLTQSNLSGEVTDADVAARSDYEDNWATVLDGLRRVVEASMGRPEPAAMWSD